MKKRLLTLSTLILGSTSIFAQLPVSQTVQKKKYLLEEMTGIHCGYCPDGHKRANEIADNNPGKVVLVNVHAGSFATPSAGEPNLKTTDGTAIDNWFISFAPNDYGYPTGASNRRDNGGRLDANRGEWAGLASTIINEDSPVNLAMEASLDAATRQVTVNVQIYYTSPFSNGTNHYLNVGILQDNFEGPQSGASLNPSAILPNGKYLHQHIFRGFINSGGTWGDVIDASSTGVISKTYTYTLPASINSVNLDISNLKFFAFIGQGHNSSTNSQVYTAEEVDPTYTNVPSATANLVSVTNTLNIACDNPATFTPIVKVTNSGEAITSLAFSVAVNGGTPYVYNWTGNIGALGTAEISIPNIPSFVPSASNNTVQITLTSVNGGNGVVGSTSTASKAINIAPASTGSVYTVEVLTDNYPAETTWKLVNSSGTVVASGGPYVGNGQNSGGADALKTKSHAVTLTASDCYDFKLFDSYGDGMAYGTNPGGGYGFKIKQGNTVIYSKISTPYNCSTSTGNGDETVDVSEGVLNLTYSAGVKLEELNNTLSVYPNPASSQINVEFLADNIDYTISITDLSGRVISSKEYSKLSGNQNIEVSLNGVSEGNYILTVSSEFGKVNKNISVK